MHHCLPVGIRDTKDGWRFFSFPVYKLYLMDSYRTHTEPGLKVSTWTTCYLCTLKVKPLPSPQSVPTLSDLQARAGLFFSSSMAPRDLTHLTLKKGLNYQFLRTISKWNYYIVCPVCIKSWVFVKAQSRQHHKLL